MPGIAYASGVVAVDSTRLPAGSITAPAVGFALDPTTGIYQVTAGQINFTISGGLIYTFTQQAITPYAAGFVDLGTNTFGFKRLYMDYTNTATIGAVTINKSAGRVNIAAAASSVVVTNSNVTANSHIFCNIAQNDTTALLKNVVAAAGSFTVTLNAAATANTAVDFFVVNAD